MHQLTLRHYTLSVPPLNAIHAKADGDKFIINEGIMGGDHAVPSPKSIKTLISATNSLNGKGGSQILERDSSSLPC